MLRGRTLANILRQWGLAVIAAAVGFAAAVVFLGIVSSVMLALVVFSTGAVVAFARERRQHRQAAVALNNMTLGLSMYDGAARLVLCNERYIEMSLLPPDNFRAARRSA